MKVEKLGKVLRLFLGLMLFSVLVYGILNIVQSGTQAVPFKGPTPTPIVTPTPTPTTTVTPTPTLPPPTNEVEIQIIAQEDQKREKSVMQLCSTNLGDEPCASFDDRDLHAEYKILFTADGLNVDPDTLTCKVVEKEVCHVPSGKTPSQFFEEKEGTDTFDVSDLFVCKFRKSAVPGTGVLDVYFIGDANDPIFIGDHILKVEATKGTASGAVIQDICILDFPQCRCEEYNPFSNECGDGCQNRDVDEEDFFFPVPWPGGGTLNKFADPMAGFSSCKNLAIFQRNVVAEFPVQLCFFASGTIIGQDGAALLPLEPATAP